VTNALLDPRVLTDTEVEVARTALFSAGYCHLRQVLPAPVLGTLSREVRRLSENAVTERRQTGWFYNDDGDLVGAQNLDQFSDEIFRLARTRGLTAIAERLVGGARCVPFLTEYFGKPARRSAPTPTHQDQVFYRRFFDGELGITLWCPLVDIGPADAPLEYAAPNAVPGQYLEHGDSDTFGAEIANPGRFTFRTVTAARGDIVVHHAYSIHRSAANTSGSRDRAAVAFSYRTSQVRTWPVG
jgi:hypothetical protein